MANSSRNPNDVLSDATQKGYSRILFQQGKPVCDFELTLLGDLANPQRMAAQYIGSGVPIGSDDSFAIENLDIAGGDFTIRAGRCLVNGFEVLLGTATTYRTQPHKEQVRAFPKNKLINVYLRVFPSEITDREDEALQNKGDVGIVTTFREKTDWEVLATDATINLQSHFLLATFNTKQQSDNVTGTLVDRRRKGLTMAKLRDEFDALGGTASSLNNRLNASLNPDGTLKNNVVGNTQLVDNAVTTDKIGDGSVTNKKLAANAVTNLQLANNAVTADKIADGSVTNKKLAANVVTNLQLADNAVTADKIADGSVTSKKLAANAVANPELPNNSVTADKLADGSVNSKKLAANAVTNLQLADNAVTADKIVDGSVTTKELADNAVTADKIVDGSVTTKELADNAVSKRTIQDKAVSIAKLGNLLVSSVQTSIPKSVAGAAGQVIIPLLEGEEHAFFLISVRLIGPRVLGKTSVVNWIQRSICGITTAAGNPQFHQHQLVLQNFSTTDILEVACKAYRINEA